MYIPKNRKKFFAILFLSAVFVAAGGFLAYRFLGKGRVLSDTVSSVPVRQSIVYINPLVWESGTILSNADVAKKFGMIVYARNNFLKYLDSYKAAGFTGDTYVYMTALNEFAAPNQNYASLDGMKKECTEISYQAYSDKVNMDAGDFCELQNAIVGKTCLAEYPDICPTESFFLHKQDGTRYSGQSGNAYSYKPNPGDENYRKYTAYRALRELIGGYKVTAGGARGVHSPSGAKGVFLDNVELTYGEVVRHGGVPKEYATSEAYAQSVYGLVKKVHDQLHDTSKGYNFPVWGNMISANNNGSDWDKYSEGKILEGGMMEDFALNWGKGPHSSTVVLNQLNNLEKWVSSGRYFLATPQGNRTYDKATFERQLKYSLGLYLLVTDGDKSGFKLMDYGGSSGNHYDFPDYYLALGKPASGRRQISSSPVKYERLYECGKVEVDITNATSIITTSQCNTDVTPIATTTVPTTTTAPTTVPTGTSNGILIKAKDMILTGGVHKDSSDSFIIFE